MGRYCQNCGQENLEPKETFLHLVTHFVNDVTHFDGKFFSTLKLLLFRPGFLSKEYVKGRRMSYLHPIRMYVFTSALFFIIFFSVIGGKGTMGVKTDSFATLNSQRTHKVRELSKTTDLEDRRDILKAIYSKDTDVVRLNEVRNQLIKDGFNVDADTAGMGTILASVQSDSLAWQQGIAAVKADEARRDANEEQVAILDRKKDSLQREKDKSEGGTGVSGAAGTRAGGAYHYSGAGKAFADSMRKKEEARQVEAAKAAGSTNATGGSNAANAAGPGKTGKDSANNEEDQEDSIALRSLQRVGTITSSGDSNTTMGLQGEILPGTVEEYDRRQTLLKAGARDGWFKHLVNRRLVVLHEEYHENKKGFQKEITEAILHTFPKILFVSLPLFALMLRLLNIRRRKEILYVDHGIFTIHLYCASFIIILAMILISTLFTAIGWGNEAWIPDMILVLAFFFYQYKAMHNFYHQGRAKTIVKMVILDFFSLFLLTITTTFFIFWTVMEI